MGDLLDDLAAEHDDLDRIVADLGDAEWSASTPAAGWTVCDQIAHLHYFDRTAALAASDADAFASHVQDIAEDPEGILGRAHAEARDMGRRRLLEAWRRGRSELIAALSAIDPSDRIPWYGPAMGARSFATARLMETWAHGQDIVDALDADRQPTDRLRHVAHLGVRARPFSYLNRGMDVPAGEVRIALEPPGGGEPWTWGPEDAADRVAGPGLDFCLVVTQRRHPDDTALTAEGHLAREWLSLAQAFAGPPTAVDADRRRAR